jgi:hypothetical protein
MEFHGLNISVLLILNIFFLQIILGKNTDDGNICKSKDYQDKVLKLLHERAIADSFIDHSMFDASTKLPKKFEASDVILRSDGQVTYVVFDNTFQIGAFCTDSAMQMTSCTDQLLDWPDKSVDELDSQFEGIAYNSLQDTYFIVQEAIPTINDKKKFQPNIFEIRIGKNNSNSKIQIIESCRVDMELDSDGKGFEGLEFVVSQTTGKIYLMGLCEANKCASKIPNKAKDIDFGNGRLVVLEKKEATKKNPCSWEPVDMIHLPSSIQFIDYSAVSIYHEGLATFPTYVAITSQENSQVWIGMIEEIDRTPFFEISSLKKDITYDLPRATEVSDQCLIKYCNIEGVTWQSKNQLILVSDKSKKDQDAICNEKDQSIHYVSLPNYSID